jgi:hypothetical protein
MVYPMFMMVVLTFVVFLIAFRVRTGSVQRGEVSIKYYSVFQGENIPELVHKTTRHFANLFEVPVLFYVAGLLYLVLEQSGSFAIYCAWAFVATRVVHSFIHLGYNNVLHRLVAFAAGNACVLAMWISIVLNYEPGL